MRVCRQSPICMATWRTLLSNLPEERCAYMGTQRTHLDFTSRHHSDMEFEQGKCRCLMKL